MKDIKTFFTMINQVNYILSKKQKKQFIGLFFVGLGCALFETMGVSVVLPFVQAVITPDEILKNKYLSPVFEYMNIIDASAVIVTVGIGIVLVYLFKNIYLIAANYVQTVYRCHFYEDISIRLLNSYLKRPYSYFITTTSSVIIQSIQNDSNRVYDVIDIFYSIISQGFTILLLGVLLVFSDAFMALGILFITGVCFLIVTIGFKKKMADYGVISRNAKEEQYQYLYQPIMGNKDIKVMQRTDFFVKRFNMATHKVTKSTIVYNFVTSLPERIIESIAIAGIIGVVCVRIQMGMDAASFIPRLAVFAVAAFRILPATSRCVGYFQSLVFYRPALEASYHDMVAFNEYEKQISKFYIEEQERIKGRNITFNNLGFENSLVIDQISWKYENSNEDVIRELSMTIHKGEAVAFIGASGAGKTTLADIILGLLKPSVGNIRMDGVDIFAIPMEWSKIIGYVPQSVFLIDDTIRANVTFGLDNEEISDEAVWEALDKAQIKDYIMKLPQGLDTRVGEAGIRFSGGQKQRIAIARALYHNPDILVLDEATSALDGETEKALMGAIDHLHGVKTLIIIAHRLSTIKNCDKIYEIRDGKAYWVEHSKLFGQDD